MIRHETAPATQALGSRTMFAVTREHQQIRARRGADHLALDSSAPRQQHRVAAEALAGALQQPLRLMLRDRPHGRLVTVAPVATEQRAGT